MIELFSDVRDEIKDTARFAWSLACAQKSSVKAAEFLNTILRYYENIYTPREMEFIRFYFDM